MKLHYNYFILISKLNIRIGYVEGHISDDNLNCQLTLQIKKFLKFNDSMENRDSIPALLKIYYYSCIKLSGNAEKKSGKRVYVNDG